MKMRKIVIPDNKKERVNLSDISDTAPFFAKKGGKLVGMIVKEERGWALRLGGAYGAYGWSDTLEGCIKKGIYNLYKFYTP